MFDTRRSSFFIVSLTLLAGAFACTGHETGAGDTTPAAEQQAESSPLVPAGTELTFRLTQTLSTADVHAGDTFDAVVAEDVYGNDGQVIVPAGAPARGEVLQSKQGKGDNPAILALQMETMQVKDEWLPIDATMISADVQGEAGDTGSETAGKIAIGTAAGALIGQILGKDTESTIAGAGIGTAVGAVVALTSRAGNATIEQGSRLHVRLNAPVGTR